MRSLFESVTGLSLLDPGFLWLGLAVLLAIGIGGLRGAPAIRFAPAPLLAQLDRLGRGAAGQGAGALSAGPFVGPTIRVRMLFLPRVLQVIGLLLLVFALARPVLRTQLPQKTEGIDILLCLDTSSSMTANDLDKRQTRLDVTKEAAAQFITGRPDDRIGLICFARYPDVRCPLTLDHEALKRFLADVTVVDNEGPEDATGIGTAVARAAQVLSGSIAKSKVAILLTDGEENVASSETPDEIAPVHAGQLCAELGVRVYTIAAGIGRQNATGQWIDLDTSQVESLAEKTGGVFFEARDAGAVAGVYSAIDKLEKVELEEPRYEIEERFLPFLLGAITLVFLGAFLRSTVLEVLP